MMEPNRIILLADPTVVYDILNYCHHMIYHINFN